MVGKRILIVAAVVVLITVVAFLYFSSRPPSLPLGAKDCGADPTCFKQSLSNDCATARLTISREGIGFIADVRGPVQGATPAACLLYVKPTQFDPQGLTSEQAQAAGALKTALLASDMTCKVPLSDVASIDDPNYLMNPERLKGCEGSLKSFIEIAIQRFGPIEGQNAT